MMAKKGGNTVDHGEVGELYADRALFVLNAGGVVRISLGALRPADLDGATDTHIVGRLVMPVSSARALAARLLEIVGPASDGEAPGVPPGVSIQ